MKVTDRGKNIHVLHPFICTTIRSIIVQATAAKFILKSSMARNVKTLRICKVRIP